MLSFTLAPQHVHWFQTSLTEVFPCLCSSLSRCGTVRTHLALADNPFLPNSYNRKIACNDDSFVCIFDNYVTVIKFNMAVMIHDIFLLKPLIYKTIIS